MIYKFKSKAAGDVIMMKPGGDQVLQTIGKTPAPQGILHVADMPAAMKAIEAAVAAEESAGKKEGEADEADAPVGTGRDRVSLRQRAWPLLEMMKRAHAAGHDIVWGV
jgi:uncharacterized protein DUF1840